MPGTREGGLKARLKNKELYGEDFYKKIGSAGGKTIHQRDPETGKALKGFAISGKGAEAGRVGGRKGRRTKAIHFKENNA